MFTKKQYGSARPSLNTLKKTTKSGKKKEVRSFSIYTVNEKKVEKEDKGRYLGTPAGTASKAFTKWCKENRKKKCAGTITMVETTRGNPNKKYAYSVVRQQNNKSSVERDGETINYKFTNVVRKA